MLPIKINNKLTENKNKKNTKIIYSINKNKKNLLKKMIENNLSKIDTNLIICKAIELSGFISDKKSQNFSLKYNQQENEFSLTIKNYDAEKFIFLTQILEKQKVRLIWEPTKQEIERFKKNKWYLIDPIQKNFLEQIVKINLKNIGNIVDNNDLNVLCFLCKNIKSIKAQSDKISEKGLFWLNFLHRIEKISFIGSSIGHFECSPHWNSIESINLSESMSLYQFSGAESILKLKKIKLKNCRLIENISSIFHLKLEKFEINEIGQLDRGNFIDLLIKIKMEKIDTEINLYLLESNPRDQKHSILKNFLLISGSIDDFKVEKEAYFCFRDFVITKNPNKLISFLRNQPLILKNIQKRLKKPLYPEWILLAKNLKIPLSKDLKTSRMQRNIISSEDLISLFEIANEIKNEELTDELISFLQEKYLIEVDNKTNRKVTFFFKNKSKIKSNLILSIIKSLKNKEVSMTYKTKLDQKTETIPMFIREIKDKITEIDFIDLKNTTFCAEKMDNLLSFFPNIKKFNVSDDIFLKLSNASIEKLKEIECLKINSCMFKNCFEETNCFSSGEKIYFLEQMKNLKKIDFSSIHYMDRIDLTNCGSLEKISLINNKNLSMVRGLSSLVHLKTLIIGGDHKISLSTILDIMEELALSITKDSLTGEPLSILSHLIKNTLIIENEELNSIELSLIIEFYSFFKEKNDIIQIKEFMKKFLIEKSNKEIINLFNSNQKLKEKIFNKSSFINYFHSMISDRFFKNLDFSELLTNEPIEIVDNFIDYHNIEIHFVEFLRSEKGKEFLLKNIQAIWLLAPNITNVIRKFYPCKDPTHEAFYPLFTFEREKKIEIYCLRSSIEKNAIQILNSVSTALNLTEEIETLQIFYYGEKGVDAQGLSRDFTRNLFVSLSKQLKMQEGIPAWTQDSDSTFFNIGVFLRFLMNQKENNKYPLGSVFSFDFFKGLNLFSNQQIREPFENMSEQEILDISVHLALANERLKSCSQFLDWNGTVISEEQRSKSLRCLNDLQDLCKHLQIEEPFLIENINSQAFLEKTLYFSSLVLSEYSNGEKLDLQLKTPPLFRQMPPYKSYLKKTKKKEIEKKINGIEEKNAFLGLGPRYEEGKKQIQLINDLIDIDFTSQTSLSLKILEGYKTQIKEQLLEYRQAQCRTLHRILQGITKNEEYPYPFFNVSAYDLQVFLEGHFNPNDLLKSLHFEQSVPSNIQNVITDWIKKSNEDSLKKFLVYVYGTPVIPAQGIRIFLQNAQPIALIAHTCFGHLDIFSGISEENLIEALNSIAQDNDAGQFQIA